MGSTDGIRQPPRLTDDETAELVGLVAALPAQLTRAADLMRRRGLPRATAEDCRLAAQAIAWVAGELEQ